MVIVVVTPLNNTAILRRIAIGGKDMGVMNKSLKTVVLVSTTNKPAIEKRHALGIIIMGVMNQICRIDIHSN